MTTTPQAVNKLTKFLEYVLGRHPDEFGLLPDPQGFVKIKTLLQALQEDTEWRYLRHGHLQSVMAMSRPCPIEIQDDLIRARNREHLPAAATASELPKLLFTPVRRRAYPVVLSKGVRPAGSRYILLSPDKAMALRLGRRMDNDPVLITVMVTLAQAAGTLFEKYGELLYLADYIPVQTFSGPPPPKEKTATAPPSKTAPAELPKTPGSYFPDPQSIENPGIPASQRRKHQMEWKKDRRRARKEKEHFRK